MICDNSANQPVGFCKATNTAVQFSYSLQHHYNNTNKQTNKHNSMTVRVLTKQQLTANYQHSTNTLYTYIHTKLHNKLNQT